MRVLLQAALPPPTLDLPSALAWLAYHQQRQVTAYRSHRTRVLAQLNHPG